MTDPPRATSPPPWWPAPTVSGPVLATVTLPGSKSLVARYLVLAALAEGPSVLRDALASRDTTLMADALRALGTRVDVAGDSPHPTLRVTPAHRLTTPASVDCGLAGTVMRFLPPVAALADGPVTMDGDARARERPLAPLLGALRELGVPVDSPSGGLPVTVAGRGGMRGGEVTIDASASSQFISALLLVAARCADGLVVRHRGGPLPSRPHIEMTLDVLRSAGVAVAEVAPECWQVDPGPIRALDVQVEPDLSNAAAFAAAAAITRGEVTITGWPQQTTQAGDAIRDILDSAGADVRLHRDGLTVRGSEQVYGFTVDLSEAGELTPVVAAIAALADGPSRIRGVAHLRGHETDRLAALAAEITQLGGQVTELPDGLDIVPKTLRGGRFHTYADHRLVHTAALLGLVTPGVLVQDVATTGKTLPGFERMWTDLAGG